MPVQIVKYVGAVAQGDLGADLRRRLPVRDVLMAHLPHTVQLITAAMLLAAGLGIPLGCLAAARGNGLFDRLIVVLSVSVIAVPSVTIAIYGMLLFHPGWAGCRPSAPTRAVSGPHCTI